MPSITSRKILLTDVKTGEQIEYSIPEECVYQFIQMANGSADFIGRGFKESRRAQFVMIDEIKTREIYENEDLTHTELSIWQYLTVNLSFGGEIKLTQKEIAKGTRLSLTAVNRAFAKYRKYKMIEKGRKQRGYQTYRVVGLATKGKRRAPTVDGNVITADFTKKASA